VQSSPPPLEYFVDRSLGRQDVPSALENRGLVVHTMATIYREREQFVADDEWLAGCIDANWIVLTKDKRLRQVVGRLPALQQDTLRVFILMSGNLTAAQQVERFVENLERIEAAAHEAGPFIVGVYQSQIRRLWPTPGNPP
jgi:PIN like domain